MSGLPTIPNNNGYGYNFYTSFGGVNAQKGAKDGEISDILNMTSDNYPILSSRKPRKILDTYNNNKGFICYGDTIAYISEGVGKDIFHFGENNKDLTSGGNREMIIMSNRILIFPDKKVYNVQSNTLESLETTTGSITVTFPRYGELYGSQAECNTIKNTSIDFTNYFSVGDAITISGSGLGNNAKTSVVREVTATELRFYEYAFELNVGSYTFAVSGGLQAGGYTFKRKDDYVNFVVVGTVPNATKLTCTAENTPTITATPALPTGTTITASLGTDASYTLLTFTEVSADTTVQNVTLSRTLPDMDYMFVCNNRLWGCKDDSIYASKLGDPKNFNVFDGLSTDSWSVDTGTNGDFTGACEYLGYPMFFKEQGIFKVYGDYPSQYSISKNMLTGVKDGCGKTLASAGNTLFYVSPKGVMAYTGGVPTIISKELNKNFSNGVAGTDGEKYYLSTDKIYIYDTYRQGWWIENGQASQFSLGDRLYANLLVSNTVIFTALTDLNSLIGTEESSVSWLIEFADFLVNTPKNKEVYRVEIMSDTSQLGDNDTATVYYTNDGTNWTTWGTLTKDDKHSDIVRIVPQRSKYFGIKIAGTGLIDIYNIAIYTKEDMQ